MYSNFNGLETVKPKKILFPKTIMQLSDFIKNNSKIRIVGGIHTFNDISLTHDTLINMKKLNNVINIDSKNLTVTVEAGIKLKKLLEILDTHQLALDTMPAVNNVSIAGAISTGAHGSNFETGSFCSLVKELTLIIHDGQILHIDKNINYFSCSLGCLGAIYSIKLQCVEQYSIVEEQIKTEWSEITKYLNEILKQYPLTDVNVNQHSDNLTSMLTLRKKVPYDRKLGNGHKKLTSNIKAWYIEIELAFPIEHAFVAVEKIALFHKKYKKKYKIWTDSDLYIRFNRADESILSMASGRDTIYVSSFFGKEYDANIVYTFMKKLSDTMVKKYNARPHYGKQNNLNIDQMKLLYPNYDVFLSIKNELDPNKKFSNNYINRLF